jgi:hypothetical protein
VLDSKGDVWEHTLKIYVNAPGESLLQNDKDVKCDHPDCRCETRMSCLCKAEMSDFTDDRGPHANGAPQQSLLRLALVWTITFFAAGPLANCGGE